MHLLRYIGLALLQAGAALTPEGGRIALIF